MELTEYRNLPVVYPPNRAAWRQWLVDNHDQHPKGIWLLYYKKQSGKPSIAYHEAVEEALCFGWIDSKPNKIDEFCSVQVFTPRRPKSVWSKVNKERLTILEKANLIAAPGWKVIKAAQENGSWNSLDAIEALIVPDDLADALANNSNAEAYFKDFSKSAKKAILWWVESAKRPETRQKRIEETVRLAAQNIKANYPN